MEDQQVADIIQVRRDTAAVWTAVNPVLASGEQGLETDTLKSKFGNGTTAWNSLSYYIDQDAITAATSAANTAATAADSAATTAITSLRAAADSDIASILATGVNTSTTNTFTADQTFAGEVVATSYNETFKQVLPIITETAGYVTEGVIQHRTDLETSSAKLTGFCWNDDGSEFFCVRAENNVNKFTCSVPYDTSTANTLAESQTISIAAPSSGSYTDVAVSEDGLHMVVCKGTSTIYYWEMTTAFDLATCTFTTSKSVSYNTHGVHYADDGNYLFLNGTSNRVLRFDMTTAYDVSTAGSIVHNQSLAPNTSMQTVVLSADGTKMYLAGVTLPASIYEYELSTAYDPTSYTLFGSYSLGDDKLIGSFGLSPTDQYFYFINAGTVNPIGRVLMVKSVLVESTLAVNCEEANVFQHVLIASTDMEIINPPADGGFIDTYRIAQSTTINTPFGGTGWSNPEQMIWNPDGTEVFVAGNNVKKVHTLSTAWDLSTISTAGTDITIAEFTSSSHWAQIVWNDDGTKVYFLRESDRLMYEYTMTAGAYDWSGGIVATGNTLYVTSVSSAAAFAFNADGTELYVAGEEKIHLWTLTTGFDLSTASQVGTGELFNFYNESVLNYCKSMHISSDGTKMIILARDVSSNETVHEFTLPSPYAVASAFNADDYLSVEVYDNSASCVSFKPDGTRMFIVGLGSDKITDFDISSYAITAGTAYAFTLEITQDDLASRHAITWPTNLYWNSGAPTLSTAAGKTDVFAIYTYDGGQTYKGFFVGSDF
jgi:hypothetical protein